MAREPSAARSQAHDRPFSRGMLRCSIHTRGVSDTNRSPLAVYDALMRLSRETKTISCVDFDQRTCSPPSVDTCQWPASPEAGAGNARTYTSDLPVSFDA